MLSPVQNDEGHQIGEASDEIDNPEAGYGAADCRAAEQPFGSGHRLREVVPFPEAGPGHDEQDETGLDQVGHDQVSVHERPAVLGHVAEDRRRTLMAMSR